MIHKIRSNAYTTYELVDEKENNKIYNILTFPKNITKESNKNAPT